MLKDVQQLLIDALLSPDPAAFVRAHADDVHRQLSADERTALTGLDDAGLRVTRVLVRKLRLQRLLAGDPASAASCAADPAAFAERFRAYEAAVPPRAVFPGEEAAQFARWCDE